MTINNEETVCFTTCAGGSNVFMLAYRAASALEKEGHGKFIKLAGDRAKERDLQNLRDADKYAKKWILIEGCQRGCGLNILQNAGIKPDKHILIIDFGIERENKTSFTQEELNLVISSIKKILELS